MKAHGSQTSAPAIRVFCTIRLEGRGEPDPTPPDVTMRDHRARTPTLTPIEDTEATAATIDQVFGQEIARGGATVGGPPPS